MSDARAGDGAGREGSSQRERIDAARAEIEGGAYSLREPPLPERIHGYRVLREIHRGSQGVVYQAQQESTGRKVAIKVMKNGALASRSDRLRFEREAQILSRLDHPNIVRLHDAGTLDEGQYFVMDYISGQELDVHCRARPVDVSPLVGLFVTICDAVNAAHLKGIIHRDLKPSNIRVDAAGTPFVLDFGLAKLTVFERELTAMTQTGQFLGSLPWASPEQVAGDPTRIDTRTDVYALGVLLYQMLTGRLPIDVSGALPDVIHSIQFEAPTPPRRFNRAIDDEVQTMILRCLSKDVERRYQTAGDVGRDLQRYLDGDPIEAKRDSGWYVLRKLASRYRVPTLIGGALVVAGFIFGLAMAGLYQDARAAAEEADEKAGLAVTEAVAARQELSRLRTSYDGVVDVLERNRIDHSADSLATILEKRRRVREAVDQLGQHTQDSFFDLSVFGQDPVRFQAETAPRQSGRVVFVGPDRPITTLVEALRQRLPGDVLQLDPGEFAMTSVEQSRLARDNPEPFTDLCIVGAGAHATTLSLHIDSARRLRLQQLRIDCEGSPFLDLDPGGSVQLRDCKVQNYASGSGGSNAIRGSDGVVLYLERCEFDGATGLSPGSGRPFELGGSFALYCRDCYFLDNEELLRAKDLVAFDRCTMVARERSYGTQIYPDGALLLRESESVLGEGAAGSNLDRIGRFEHATDDVELVEALCRGLSLEPEQERLARTFDLAVNLRYWSTLSGHEDGRIASMAAKRFLSLLDSAPDTVPGGPPDTMQATELRAGRWARWLEEQGDRLRWDESRGRFALHPAE